MLLSTPAIVLHTLPYSETSVIAKVFTRQLGLRSYLVKGARRQHSKQRSNLLQPLSNLDIVVYDNPRTTLNHVKELSVRRPTPPPNPIDYSLRFFMTEVLYKALQEADPNPTLFDYIDQLDTTSTPADLPIRFLLEVAQHLGIAPLDNHTPHTPLFNLEEGRFCAQPSESTLTTNDSLLLHLYLATQHTTSTLPKTSLEHRSRLIEAMIAYFQLHLTGFNNFKSHEILHDLLA